MSRIVRLLSAMLASSVLAAGANSSSPSSSSRAVNLFVPEVTADGMVVGSVVEVRRTATVYQLRCPDNVKPTSCPFPHAATLTEGPSTMELHMSPDILRPTTVNSQDPAAATLNMAEATCKLTMSAGVASCTGIVEVGSGATFNHSSFSHDRYVVNKNLVRVIITAGAEKLGPTTKLHTPAPSSPPKPGTAAAVAKHQVAVFACLAAIAGALVVI